MRKNGIVVAAAAALFSACTATSEVGPGSDAFVDAAYRRNAAEAARPTAPAPKPAAVDAVTGELLSIACLNLEHLRRNACANIANIHTVGYKRRVAQVSVHAVTTGDGFRYQAPIVERLDRDLTPGPLNHTGRSLDCAIEGEGFFSLLLPTGCIGYTRDGRFQIDANGKVVSYAGNVLEPRIVVPPDTLEIFIDTEGRVAGRTAGSPDTDTQFGVINIQRFVNPRGLRVTEGGILRQTETSGPPVIGMPGQNGLGLLKQGFLEGSNVQLASELMDLQRLNRQYESLTRVLEYFGMIAP